MAKKEKNISYNFGQLVVLVVSGLLAGLVSYYSGNAGPLILLITPGLVFGLVIVLIQYLLSGKKFSLKSLAFVGVSTASYFIAVNIYWGLSLSAHLGNSAIQSQVAMLFIGSFVGTFLFLLGYRIISVFSLNAFILLIIWGVFLSLAFFGAASAKPDIDSNLDKQILSGFMIWQGAMALGLGLITFKKMQDAKVVALIILVLGLISIAALRIDTANTSAEKNSIKNDYQTEVNNLVPPDFTLVSSKFENQGIDVGQVLTNDYTTRLTYDQAIPILESNASKEGYLIPYQGSCFGGVQYNSDHGTLVICETNVKDGVTTFEISLTNFSKVPPKVTPSFQCVGDCKNR